MKTLLLFLLTSTLPLAATAMAQQPRGALAYAVADGTSGYILQSENASKKLPIASLTKIATAMVVLDWADVGQHDLGQKVVVPPDIRHVSGANPVGFEPGDVVTLRDLLYAALLQSDNRAAYTLANHVGRTFLTREKAHIHPVDLFVAQMNALARRLGMKNTRFLNPHGLDHEEKPYSTAEDLVALTSYAMKRSAFRFIVSQHHRSITRYPATGGEVRYNLVNTNQLLGKHDIDGVKTGRTSQAGDCLIISAARAPESVKNPDGTHTITPRRLIVVVLNSNDRFGYAERLLQYGWQEYDGWAAMGRPLDSKRRKR